MADPRPSILLTGATGYVGGRLLTALEQAGHRLRCLTRNPDFLRPRTSSTTEIVRGDLLQPKSLPSALQGVDTAYYLVHSLGAQDAYERDRQAARNFIAAARIAGLRRIIYLGGLGGGEALSPHLASRQEVGQILRDSGIPTTEFRASIIIGSGSLSFEMVRSLVRKLPVMIAPAWTRRLAQPIAIEDCIDYLVAALDLPSEQSPIIQIGGADRVTYLDLMKSYARLRHIRRLIIPVPVLTPYLSSLWLGLVTPLYARVGRRLIESVRNQTIVEDDTALRLFPQIQPKSCAHAIERALHYEDNQFAQTRWSDALSSAGVPRHYGGIQFGSRLVDSRSIHVPAPPTLAFTPIRRIGGKTGWYYGNYLWQIRGFLDLIFAGVGLRRGRRDQDRLRPGDTLDFWRVEAIEPDRLLRLYAEMKLPGRAWLQFEVQPDDHGGSTIRQTALFDPIGLIGLLYWYALYPIHELVFAGMLRGIAQAIPQPQQEDIHEPYP